MSLPSEEKLAEYYALAKILGFQQSFEAFKIQFEEHFKKAMSSTRS